MRFYKNEQGFTLIELLASVVVLGILVIPFTSIGTTAFRWQAEDEQLSEAVLLAEQKMQDVKQSLFAAWEPIAQETDDPSSRLRWKISMDPVTLDGVAVTSLMKVTVTITGHDLASDDPAARKQITELSTVVRKRESQP
ncbi:MAG: type II secretion system protein [Tumebacillaceae bacterium]